MAYKVQWSAAALDGLIKILDFIAGERPRAASRVVDDILARTDSLADFPRLGPKFSEDSGPDLRRLILGSYIVIYQVQDTKRVVSVLAVRHGRQRPLTLEEIRGGS